MYSDQTYDNHLRNQEKTAETVEALERASEKPQYCSCCEKYKPAYEFNLMTGSDICFACEGYIARVLEEQEMADTLNRDMQFVENRQKALEIL